MTSDRQWPFPPNPIVNVASLCHTVHFVARLHRSDGPSVNTRSASPSCRGRRGGLTAGSRSLPSGGNEPQRIQVSPSPQEEDRPHFFKDPKDITVSGRNPTRRGCLSSVAVRGLLASGTEPSGEADLTAACGLVRGVAALCFLVLQKSLRSES